jgi:flagellar biosynthesis protein FlhF
MRIQRYIAKDMRSALGQVREAMGPEAVILSTGTIGDQVEVVAAIDVEVAREFAAPRGAAPLTQNETIEHMPLRRASSQLSEALVPKVTATPAAAPAAPAQAAQPAEHSELANEVKDMRRMLEAQLATLAWNDMSRRSPLQAAMLKELAQLGITQDLAGSLARKIPPSLNFSAARRFALATIARTVQVTGDRWLETGGRIAFAGPAGAGKTTLLAKLAARWVLRHGPRRVALVSADAVRIGAHEQMHMLGRLLGVTAHTVYDVAELPELLEALSGQQLVLIDTAGASPRDPGSRAPAAPHEPGEFAHRNFARDPGQHPGGRHRGSHEVVRGGATQLLRDHQGGRSREPGRRVVGAGATQVAGGLRQRRPASAGRSATRSRAFAGEPRGGNCESQRRDRGRRGHAAPHHRSDRWPSIRQHRDSMASGARSTRRCR